MAKLALCLTLGRVLFVAVMNRRVRGDFARLGRDLRLALR